MPSVARAVAEIVEKRPFLEEALATEIVNYSYLAELLKPDVENEVGREVKRSAIIMALRRLGESLKGGFVGNMPIKFKGSDITVKSGIFELTVPRTESSLRSVPKLYELVDFSKGDFLTVTQGLYEITILSNSKYKVKIGGLFGKIGEANTIDMLASITVKIPKEAVGEVGAIYMLIKALSWNNINIIEIVSTFTELTFIIRESDTGRAFNSLMWLVHNQQ